MDRFRHARGLNPHHQAIISQSSPGRLPVRATTLIFLWITLIQRIISRSPRANTEPLRSGGLTLYERLAALTAAGRVAKTDHGYRLADR
jgi:hypothetical protein